MKKATKKERKGLPKLPNPLYLNANLIYSEALNYIKKEHWRREIKSGTLVKLRKEGYDLVTSILTRMEIVQRLKQEENLNPEKARKVYHSILNDHQILEITAIDKHVILNDPYIDAICSLDLDFKDVLHLTIAKKLNIPLCTHDKKALGNFSQHREKTQFYDKVFKPEELIKPQK